MTAHFFLLLFVAFLGSCTSKRVGAYVNLTSGSEDITGVIFFKPIEGGMTQVRGTIYGLTPGVHGVHIHENGDISNKCANVGDHFDPYNEPHGVHVGDVANIIANDKGVAKLNVNKARISFSGPATIIGHSLGIDAEEDLYGDEVHHTIACGIIQPIRSFKKPRHPSDSDHGSHSHGSDSD